MPVPAAADKPLGAGRSLWRGRAGLRSAPAGEGSRESSLFVDTFRDVTSAVVCYRARMVASLAAEEHVPRRMTLEAWAHLWSELDELAPDEGEGDVEK